MLQELIASADVLVQNLAPGAAARMGLGAAALQARHPALIVCDISGYGEDGPYRDKKAYDLLIQSEAGFLSVTGTPEDPCKSGNSIADIAAGMYAYTSVLAALLQRGKTGKGSHIDVSMLESLAEWMGYPMYYAYQVHRLRRAAPRRTPPSTRMARSPPAMAAPSCWACRTSASGASSARRSCCNRRWRATCALMPIRSETNTVMRSRPSSSRRSLR